MFTWIKGLESWRPPYVLRRLRWSMAIYFGLNACAMAVHLVARWIIFPLGPSRPENLDWYTLLGPFLAITAAHTVWCVLFLHGLMQRAKAAGFQLCPECAYDLSSHTPPPPPATSPRVTCPECGSSVNLWAARQAWEDAS